MYSLLDVAFDWKAETPKESDKLSEVVTVIGHAKGIKREVDTQRITENEGYQQLLELIGVQ